jgi:DNA-binding LacI/PurR family transcriptional regulator
MANATIKDVARRAGVGLGTVSRVLNNHPRVSADTRERVLHAIAELGFRPNATARRLPRKTDLRHIGVLTHPFVKNYHSIAERLRGMQRELEAAGKGLEIVLFVASSPDHYAAHLTSITQNTPVMGLIIIDLDLTPQQEQVLRSAHIPFVGINNFVGRSWPCVSTDNEEGGYVAARFLTALGHRRIAYIGDNLFDSFGFPTSQARYTGYARALNEVGIHLNTRYVKLGDHGYEAAARLTRELVALAQPPTAIFAMSDLQAAGCIGALREMKLRVPDDISVMGYDDTELALSLGLTTVRQHLELSGQLGMQWLLAMIEGQEQPSPPALPPVEVVTRLTTGAPRKLGVRDAEETE